MIRNDEQGSVLIIIFISIALFAALSFSVVNQNQGNSKRIVDSVQVRGEINHLIDYMSAIKNKVSVMVDVNLVNPSNVKDLKHGDVGYDTAPHVDKIFHPLGGGVLYDDSIGGTSGLIYHNSLVIKDIGTALSELAMVAIVPSVEYCQGINEKLYGNNDVPIITATAYTSVTTAVAVTLDDATTCNAAGGCDGVLHQCVTDGSGNYVYYHILYAL